MLALTAPLHTPLSYGRMVYIYQPMFLLCLVVIPARMEFREEAGVRRLLARCVKMRNVAKILHAEGNLTGDDLLSRHERDA